MKMKAAILLSWLVLGFNACDFGFTGGGGGTSGEGLTGIIVDSEGQPVSGAKVRVFPEDYSLAKPSQATAVVRRDSTTTDSDGRFRFTNLATGRYNLEASAQRGGTLWSLFVPGIYLDRTLDLGEESLYTTGSLRVPVRDVDNAPFEGAACRIVGGPWETVSDSMGTCLLAELPPGRYRVLVTFPGMQSVVKEDLTVISGQQAQSGNVTLVPSASGTDTTWTTRYSVEGENISDVVWSGKQLVAVGSGVDVYGDGYGLILTSPDGITWTKRNSGTTVGLQMIAWGGDATGSDGQYVALGSDGGTLLTSPDGIEWTPRATPDSTWPVTSIAWSGTRFLVTAWTYNMVSTDGITWTQSEPDTDIESVVYAGSQFVGVGNGVWTSPDGVNWTERDAQTTNTLRAIAWGNGQFVAVGSNGTIRTSADGITWEKRVSGTTGSGSSVVWVNGRWIVDGNLTSTDGILWTPVASPYYPPLIVSTGTRLIGVRYAEILTSP